MAVVMIVARCVLTSYVTGAVGAPTYEQIRGALRAARLAGNASARGDWIGAPRVSRTDTTVMGGLREWTVTVAAVYGWPSGGPWAETAPGPGLAEALRAAVFSKLDELHGSWSASAVPYECATHGALAWWASGEASHTRTRDESPGISGGLVDAPDNPTGPTTDATHPTTPAGAAGGAVRAASGSLPWLAIVAAAGAIGLIAWRFGGRESVIVLDSRGRRRSV